MKNLKWVLFAGAMFAGLSITVTSCGGNTSTSSSLPASISTDIDE